MPMPYFADDWCNLSWTPWVPLAAAAADFRVLPTTAGVYRLRAADDDHLAYIGQTGRNLRERLRSLARNVHTGTMPYNDPHTAAPALWLLRVVESAELACSAASVALDSPHLHGLEDLLLWRHHHEAGRSARCNHGWFHPGYSRPGNRSTKRAGRALPPDQPNPAAAPGLPPLQLHGTPPDPDWMGLPWSPLGSLTNAPLPAPAFPGVYKILDATTLALLYIGESANIAARLRSHVRRPWSPHDPLVAWNADPALTLSLHRRERESDLLGAYFSSHRHPPVFQYWSRPG